MSAKTVHDGEEKGVEGRVAPESSLVRICILSAGLHALPISVNHQCRQRLIQVLQPEQLVTIVIALKLGPGLPVVGVRGFEYTAFDQASSVSSGAVCGSSTPCHHFGVPGVT